MCDCAGIGDVRLSGSCRGEVQIYVTGLVTGTTFHSICDRNFGDEEAQVACRQVGCNPVGAVRGTGRQVA